MRLSQNIAITVVNILRSPSMNKLPEKLNKVWHEYYLVYRDTTNYKVNMEMLDDLSAKIDEIIDYLKSKE